jgi:Pyridoxamine 5'-phosphate oxidase
MKRCRGGVIMTVEEARRILQTDEVPQHLLSSPIMAQLAYTWRDGSPRVVSMWFHWTGEDILMGAPSNSSKMKVLAVRPQIAISIDTVDWPYKWLTLHGTASVQVSPEPFAEYLTMACRYLGNVGGEQFLTALCQTLQGWTRIASGPRRYASSTSKGASRAHGRPRLTDDYLCRCLQPDCPETGLRRRMFTENG